MRRRLVLIVASLAWYFISDRLTPYTSQARVQAFVVPVAAEVAGAVLKVYVKNNDEVQPGQRLCDIDPTPYRIALQRSRSDYESVRRSVNSSQLAVEAARAGLQAAVADRINTEQDSRRLEQIFREDPGRDLAAPRAERASGADQGPQPGKGGRGRAEPRPGGGRRQAATTTRN
jgi:multidrug resistance efflux pump